MSATVCDYSGVVSLLPLNWEADEDAFQYLLDGAIDRITDALAKDGVPMDAPNVRALYDAAWAYRAKVRA